MWSPSVIRSTPAWRSCLNVPGVMPEPPEAFSALAMTRSNCSRSRRRGRACFTNVTPGGPTMSPRKRMRIGVWCSVFSVSCQCWQPNTKHQTPNTRLACKLHGPRLADHRHLDLAGVVELLLDGLGDVAADLDRVAVARLAGVGDDAHLAAGLDGVRVLHTGEARRHRLQLLQALDVLLQRLAAGARARRWRSTSSAWR